MPRRGLQRSALAEARAAARTASAAWAAHKKLCWQCHAAGGRPGLFCDTGFEVAQALSRAWLAVGAARGCPDQAQGRLL